MSDANPPGPGPTPFDNPFFLPVLLLLLGLWFAYDGWWNPEIKAVMFNRVGAALLLSGATFTGLRAWREKKGASDPGSTDAH